MRYVITDPFSLRELPVFILKRLLTGSQSPTLGHQCVGTAQYGAHQRSRLPETDFTL